jgi:hypothetical protein
MPMNLVCPPGQRLANIEASTESDLPTNVACDSIGQLTRSDGCQMREPGTGNGYICQLGWSRTLFPTVCAMLCLACAKSAPKVAETYTAAGQKAYTLDCAGQSSIACQAAAGRLCAGNGYNVVDQTGDSEPHRSMILTCGLSPKDIRSDIESGLDQRCPIRSPTHKSEPFDLTTAKPVTQLDQVYDALRSADAEATAAQREIAIRDAVASIQNGTSTQDAAVIDICCSTYEIASRYRKPGMGKDAVRLTCEVELKNGTPTGDPQ